MIPIEQKAPPGDRTAAEWNDVAKATRRRRRILQSRILFCDRPVAKWGEIVYG